MNYDINTVDIFEPIRPDIGIGIEFENEYGKWKSVHNDVNRILCFNYSSWKGISIGAIHYYGYFNRRSLSYICLEDYTGRYKIGKEYSIYGAFKCPTELDPQKYRITRKLTKEEIIKDHHRWNFWEEGADIDCWESLEELLIEAKKVFNRCFVQIEINGKQWVLEGLTEAFEDLKNGDI